MESFLLPWSPWKQSEEEWRRRLSLEGEVSWRLANQIVHPGFLCLEELNHPGHLKKTRRLLAWIGLCLWPLSLASRSSCFGFRLPAPFPATAASCTIGSRNYKKVLKLLQEWREIKSTHRGLRVKKKKKTCLSKTWSSPFWETFIYLLSSLETKESVWTLSQNLYVSQHTSTGTLEAWAIIATMEEPTRDFT